MSVAVWQKKNNFIFEISMLKIAQITSHTQILAITVRFVLMCSRINKYIVETDEITNVAASFYRHGLNKLIHFPSMCAHIPSTEALIKAVKPLFYINNLGSVGTWETNLVQDHSMSYLFPENCRNGHFQ